MAEVKVKKTTLKSKRNPSRRKLARTKLVVNQADIDLKKLAARRRLVPRQ